MASVLISVVTVVAIVTTVRCLGDCDLVDTSTEPEIKDFLHCLIRQLYTIDHDIDDVTSQDSNRDDYGNFQYTVNYEDMQDFPFCQGLRSQQCASLLGFLEQMLTSGDDSLRNNIVTRNRRASPWKMSAYNMLKKFRPMFKKMDPESRKNLLMNYKWRIKNGYGKSAQRFGRSIRLDKILNEPSTSPDGQTKIDINTGNVSPSTSSWESNGGAELPKQDDDMAVPLHRERRGVSNLEKLDMTPEIRQMLSKFREWRGKHGYGKSLGRWG